MWRIIQMLNSLMVRVLKGRYFKNKDNMDVEMGSNPSYVWRSLIWVKNYWVRGYVGELVMDILLGRIKTTGSQIYQHTKAFVNPCWIWIAKWIVTWITMRCRTNQWLYTISVFEDEAILNVSLNRRGCEDVRYWIRRKDCKYSVKVRNHLEVNSAAPHPSQSAPPNLLW